VRTIRAARLLYAAHVALALVIAGCGGGGGGGSSTPPPPPATPSPTPTLPPSSSGTLTVSTGSPSSATFGPVAGGYSGTITVPAASAIATLSATFSSSAVSGLPQPQNTHGLPATIGASGIVPIAYITVTSNVAVTFAALPSFTLTTSGAPPANAYVAEYDPTNAAAGWTTILGPAAAGGTVLTFTGGPPPLTLAANKTYAFMIFSVPQPLPTPTPVPTPQGSPSVSPSTARVTSLDTPVLVTVTELGYAGTYSVNAPSCSGIASVGAAPRSNVFIVNGIAAGTCSATFTDSFLQSVALPITVTTSDIVVH
jgi:hypothetical protein